MNYIINNKTLYLLFDGHKTFINEENIYYSYKGNVINEILENSCIYYGSTLKGRIIGSKNLINSKYKLPIIINDRKKIIFFQIKNENDIIWFNFNKIMNYHKNGNFINIEFNTKYVKKFKLSWSIFNNQILKSSRLLLVYLSHSKK